MLVSIVIPCYNSEHTIGKVVELAIQEFEKLENYECEFVLVNDYSRDGTWNSIRSLTDRYPNVKGINLAKNFGQHNAIMAALSQAEGDLIVGMDDDMQNHPSQIPQFLNKMEEGYDIVFGVFKQRKFSVMKNITGAISRYLLWHLLDRPKDIQMSSFWCCRKYVRDEVVKYDGYNIFLQVLFFRTTHNIANIDIAALCQRSRRIQLQLPKRIKTVYVLSEFYGDPAAPGNFFRNTVFRSWFYRSSCGTDPKTSGSVHCYRVVVPDVCTSGIVWNLLPDAGDHRRVHRKTDPEH